MKVYESSQCGIRNHRENNINTGFEVFHFNGKKIEFILRNAPNVTNVKTYTYRGLHEDPKNEPQDRWRDRLSWDDKRWAEPGYSPIVAYSWQDIILEGKQSKSFTVSIGVGPYLIPHTLTLETHLDAYYDPSTRVALRLKTESTMRGKEVVVSRTTTMPSPYNSKKTVKRFTDSGSTEIIDDTLDAPRSEGRYSLTYTIESAGLSKQLQATILYSYKPKFTIPDELPRKLTKQSQVRFTINTVYSQNFRIVVENKANSQPFFQKSEQAKNSNTKTFSYKLPAPSSLSVGNSYNFEIYLVNEFNIKSDPFRFNFAVVDHIVPEFELTKEISTFYRIDGEISIRGRVKDLEGNGQTCIQSFLNNSTPQNYHCEAIRDSIWHDISFKISLRNIPESLNLLNIQAKNTYKFGEVISRRFAIYSEKALRLATVKNCSPRGDEYFVLFMATALL